jgi:hypothetical protein
MVKRQQVSKVVLMTERALFMSCRCGFEYRRVRDDGSFSAHTCPATQGDPSRAGPYGDLLSSFCMFPGPIAPEVHRLRNRHEASRSSRGRDKRWWNLKDVHAFSRFHAVGALTSIKQHSASAVASRIDKFAIAGRDKTSVSVQDGYSFFASADFTWCPCCRR